MPKSRCIGIIAEGKSDFETVAIIIRRILNRTISFKKFVGTGCGKIINKAAVWANILRTRGCDTLLIVHDLDNNDHDFLFGRLRVCLEHSPFARKLICIPVQEIEAWLLCDGANLKKLFSTAKELEYSKPEEIDSPKEKLQQYIYRATDGRVTYLTTKHNQLIAQKMNFAKVLKKCQSFERLYDFITKNC